MARNDLILRIGAELAPLKRALKDAESTLLSTGRKLESIGQTLSFRLSAPIAAAGAASITAFANFEKLEKSLSAVSGSASEAEATLGRLRKLALQPGIDLENAVTASIRLQTVGLEAQKAEDLILQFSKAVTLAGGTGEDLGEVVRQLTQIISRGAILREDFSVIQERVPAIGIALQQAFGTTNIEAIRETGISARDFVDSLTDGIRASEEFQNVQGGLSNSINNFQQAIQASLVTLGRSISESVNLEKVLDDVSSVVARVAEGFAALSPETKRTIINVAAVAAAIGPLLVAFGALSRVLSLATLGINTLLGPVGAVIAAVTLLTSVFLKYNNQLDAVDAANERVNAALSDATQLAEQERTAVNDLIKVIESETATKGEKARAIEELKRISPDYFGNLDIERIKTGELTEASNAYNASLLQRFELQRIEEEEVKIKEQLAAAQNELNRGASLGNTLLAALGGNLTSFTSGTGQAARETKVLTAQLEELDKRRQAIVSGGTPDLSPVSSPSRSVTVTPSGSGPARPGTVAQPQSIISLAADETRIFNTLLAETSRISSEAFSAGVNADIQEFASRITTTVNPLTQLGATFDILNDKSAVFGENFNLIQEKLSATQNALTAAIENGYSPTSTVVQFLTGQMQLLTEELENQQAVLQNMEAVAKAYSSAFNAAAQGQIKGFRDVGRAALGAAADVVRAKLLEATASFFADAFAKLGIFGAVLAAGAGAIIGGLFGAVTSKLNIPALADGGIVNRPTLALIGEAGPEAVVPLSRPNRFTDQLGGQQELIARIDGEELYFFLRRIESNINRVG